MLFLDCCQTLHQTLNVSCVLMKEVWRSSSPIIGSGTWSLVQTGWKLTAAFGQMSGGFLCAGFIFSVNHVQEEHLNFAKVFGRLFWKPELVRKNGGRVTGANGFALWELCLYEGERERWRGCRAWGAQTAKPSCPCREGAVEASNKLLHVIWMRPELPAEQSEDLGPVWI